MSQNKRGPLYRGGCIGNAVQAIIDDVRALDKTRGSSSSDLIAYARLINSAFERDAGCLPISLCRPLLEAFIDSIVDFGTIPTPLDHSDLGPFLIRLPESGNDWERRKYVQRHIAEKTRANEARKEKIA